MTINMIALTDARWRRLNPELRTELREVLGGKSAIIGRQVIDVARHLCGRGAYDLAFDLYQELDGQSSIPSRGCGFGLLITLRDLMGEDPAELGATVVL
jgi:hypothetical protein